MITIICERIQPSSSDLFTHWQRNEANPGDFCLFFRNLHKSLRMTSSSGELWPKRQQHATKHPDPRAQQSLSRASGPAKLNVPKIPPRPLQPPPHTTNHQPTPLFLPLLEAWLHHPRRPRFSDASETSQWIHDLWVGGVCCDGERKNSVALKHNNSNAEREKEKEGVNHFVHDNQMSLSVCPLLPQNPPHLNV